MQPGEAEAQEVAALRGDEGVQLVEHHPLEAAKQLGRLAVGDQQSQLLGGGEQDVGRARDLPGPLVRRGVAGAGLDPDPLLQPDSRDRRLEVAGDVDRERFRGEM